MKELRIIPGKHKCGKKMDMRIADVKDDNEDVVSWIIFGVCKNCDTVVMLDLFVQLEEPIQDVDFLIDQEIVLDETSLASEDLLAKDWNKEDEAWKDL